jgi:hypothetical protein
MDKILSSMRTGNGELPPHDAEAEAGALGCVLSADNGEAEAMLGALALDDFYDIRNEQVFSALCSLALDRKRLDSVALEQWLKEHNAGLDREARDSFLTYVAGLPDATPSPANYPTYLEVVKGWAVRRAALRDAGELARLASDPAIPPAAIGEAAHRMAEAHAARGNGALPELIDAASFIAEPLQRPAELIAGVLHTGSKLVLGGGSKSFKTWCLLDLALSVAHGQPWLCFETAPGDVLYCNFEIQPWSWQKRISTVAEAKGITIEPGRVSLLNLRGMAADFDVLLPQIRDRAKQDFALVVLDPIYKLYGRTDENKAGDVARLLNGIEDLAVKCGAAVAFGAHFSKGNQASKESLDRISGSGVFARDPDSLLVFTRHEQEGAFTVEATLRNFPPVQPFAVRWQFPLMRLDAALDPAKLKQAGGRKQEHDAGDLLALLPAGGLATTAWQTKAEKESGISRRTFYRLKKALETSSRVLQSKINDKWQPIAHQVPK